jgi:hypothetical protein
MSRGGPGPGNVPSKQAPILNQPDDLEVHEVLVEGPNGHQTVVRVRAKDKASAAKKSLIDFLRRLGLASSRSTIKRS